MLRSHQVFFGWMVSFSFIACSVGLEDVPMKEEDAVNQSNNNSSSEGSKSDQPQTPQEGNGLCGNGRVDPGEKCDDGNRENELECPYGTELCELCNNDCSERLDLNGPVCGDGKYDEDNEECDDGNQRPDDGCSPNCILESSCGDGIVEGLEGCDDGNDEAGDGCSTLCEPEEGYSCIGMPSDCISRCRDGIQASDEECDDGNQTNGDGCDNNCIPTGCGNGIRTGDEECDVGPIESELCDSNCKNLVDPICGDGVVNGDDECDPSSQMNDPGCDDQCKVVDGYECIGQEPCKPICGDGQVIGDEACDEGEDNSDDWSLSAHCNSRCTGEAPYCGDDVKDAEEECDGSTSDQTCQSLGYAEEGELKCDATTCQFDRSDCSDCGNGTVDQGEDCDPSIGSNTCVSENYDGGELSCDTRTCLFDYTKCTDCNNGVAEGEESCDQDDLRDRTCQDLGHDDGRLTCTTKCEYEESECTDCGDGSIDSGEECDDGNAASSDGCSASCEVEQGWNCGGSSRSICVRIPNAPVVVGETNAGHRELTWQWNLVDDADTYQWRIDGGSVQTVSGSTIRITETLSTGSHTFSVRACNIYNGCSRFTDFTTQIQFFGAGVWQGARKEIPRSPHENTVAIACHNCYSGPNDEVIDANAANSKISNAVNRGADLIEIDIADIDGELFATHDDVAAAGSRPSFQALLNNATFRNSQAMLAIEIKETDVSPSSFADRLLAALNENRDYIQNGRLVVIKAFDGLLNYVVAVKERASRYPLIEYYLRYWLLYSSQSDIESWQNEVQRDVVDNGLDGIEVEYRSNNIYGILQYARSLGLGTGIWTIPGPAFGEVSIAAMRDDVDLMTCEYRVDYAADIVEDANSVGYFNSYQLTTSSSNLEFLYNTNGTLNSISRTLNVAPTSTRYGSPSVVRLGLGNSLYGGVLYFQAGTRAIELLDTNARNGEGFLVTAVVQLGDITPANGQTIAILNKSESSGFALELFTPSGGASVLRFGVYVNDGYIYHSYPVAGGSANSCTIGSNGEYTAPLNGSSSYFLTGAYDGNGGIYVFINNQCAGATRPTVSGTVTSGSVPVLAGADPQPSAATQARYYYDHYIQQASVQLWGDHSGHSIND